MIISVRTVFCSRMDDHKSLRMSFQEETKGQDKKKKKIIQKAHTSEMMANIQIHAHKCNDLLCYTSMDSYASHIICLTALQHNLFDTHIHTHTHPQSFPKILQRSQDLCLWMLNKLGGGHIACECISLVTQVTQTKHRTPWTLCKWF